MNGDKTMELLEIIGELIKAIDDEIDWFIASFTEKDPKRRLIARTFSNEKRKELKRLAGEAYERFK